MLTAAVQVAGRCGQRGDAECLRGGRRCGRGVCAGEGGWGRFVREIQNMDYGSREFTVKDPEGHSWSVGTYDPWAAHS